jgi:hypothetical protein
VLVVTSTITLVVTVVVEVQPCLVVVFVTTVVVSVRAEVVFVVVVTVVDGSDGAAVASGGSGVEASRTNGRTLTASPLGSMLNPPSATSKS